MIYKVCDFFNNQKVQFTLVTFKVQQKCINVQCIFYTKSIVFVYQMVYIISRLCCEHLPDVRLPCAAHRQINILNTQGVYYESESIAVLQGTGAGRTLYEGGTDAVDYAAVFKPCNLTAGAGAWHAFV